MEGGSAAAQLFSRSPSAWPTFRTGEKIAWTSASNCSSSVSAAHSDQLRIFSGFALPAIVVAISGLASENYTASLARELPRARQTAAAARAAAFTSSGSLSQAGSGASVSNRALNGPALITPIFLAFR